MGIYIYQAYTIASILYHRIDGGTKQIMSSNMIRACMATSASLTEATLNRKRNSCLSPKLSTSIEPNYMAHVV